MGNKESQFSSSYRGSMYQSKELKFTNFAVPTLGLNINYPDTWQVDQDSDANNFTLFTLCHQPNQSAPEYGIDFIKFEYLYSHRSLIQEYEHICHQLMLQHDSFQVTSTAEPLQIDDKDSVTYRFEYRDESLQDVEEIHVIIETMFPAKLHISYVSSVKLPYAMALLSEMKMKIQSYTQLPWHSVTIENLIISYPPKFQIVQKLQHVTFFHSPVDQHLYRDLFVLQFVQYPGDIKKHLQEMLQENRKIPVEAWKGKKFLYGKVDQKECCSIALEYVESNSTSTMLMHVYMIQVDELTRAILSMHSNLPKSNLPVLFVQLVKDLKIKDSVTY